MIPISLYLKNFMSYGDNVPPINFTTFHVACLCGNNGNGKSAIIDAITWVLWGEGRKVSINKKPDDGLLRIGASEMIVEFIFELEDDRFRVIRQYSKNDKKNNSILEFDVFNSETGEFVNITQKTIAMTQQKINEYLRMEYDTFINSSVMLQGRADEFAMKKASERKKLLSEILGLSMYDLLSEKARDKFKDADNRLKLLDEERINIEREISSKKTITERLGIIIENLKNFNLEIEKIDNELILMREKKVKLSIIKDEVEKLKSNIKREEENFDQLNEQHIQLEEDLHRASQILNEEAKIIEDYNLYNELLHSEEQMMEKSSKIIELRKKKTSLENKISNKRNQILLEINSFEEKLKSLQAQLMENFNIINDKENIEKGYFFMQDLECREKEALEKFKNLRLLEEKKLKIEKSISEKESSIIVEINILKNKKNELEKKAILKDKIEIEISELRKEIIYIEEMDKKRQSILKEDMEESSRISNFQEKIQELENKLKEEREKWKNIGKLKGANCPLCDAPFNQERKIKTLEKIKQEGEMDKQKINKLKNEIEQIKSKRINFNKQIKELEENLSLLSSKRSLLTKKEISFNEALMAIETCKEVDLKLNKAQNIIEEKKYVSEERNQIINIERLISELSYNEEDVEKIKAEKLFYSKYNQLKTKLDMAIDNNENIKKIIPELEINMNNKKYIIDMEQFAEDIRAELLELDVKINSMEYSKEEFNLIREKRKKLQDVLTLSINLENAKKQHPAIKKKFQDIKQSLKLKKDFIEEAKKELENKIILLEELPGIEEELPDKEAYLQGIRLRVNDLTSEKGNLQSIFNVYSKFEEKLLTIKEDIEKEVKNREIYKILHKAFGKDGIQALIIQNCIPEIENEANRILSRLTDNRIHLSLELLRDKKSGGLKETLDIKISDEIGTRDYELYSGGESFRTSFSIRVALAKLLARRAGTKLRTLIIDEGFGTQDTEGIENLVEAIQEISNDFDKIIVITHMEQLKNIFPTRIEIFKTSSGSNFKITSN